MVGTQIGGMQAWWGRAMPLQRPPARRDSAFRCSLETRCRGDSSKDTGPQLVLVVVIVVVVVIVDVVIVVIVIVFVVVVVV